MRKLLNTSILVFAFCFCAFAQTDNIENCPVISVFGPSGIVEPNNPAQYTAAVDTKGKNLNIEYVWSVSAGEILKGQGTKILIVRQPERENLTVTVKFNGLPKNCPNTVSESLAISIDYQARQLDEFSEPFAQISQARIQAILNRLQEDPTGQLYIIFRHKEKTSRKVARRKELEIYDSLIKHGADKDRIRVINDFGQSEVVKFWLVPAGANPPEIKDN